MPLLGYSFLLPLLFLIGFVVGTVYPWSYLLADNYYDHNRLLQILLLCALMLCWVSGGRRRRAGAVSRDRWLIVGFWLMVSGGAISLCLGLSFTAAFTNYCHWLLLFSLFLLCASMASRDAGLIAGSLVGVQALAVFTGMLYLCFAVLLDDPLRAIVIYPGVDNIRFFNQVQVFVIPLLLFMLCRPKVGILAFVVLTANLLLLLVGSARGAGVISLLLLASIGGLLPQQRPRVYRAVAALLVAGVFYVGLRSLEPQGTYASAGSSERLGMWMETLDFLQWHNVLWGIGPGNYNQFEIIYSHPHNSVLQFLIEWGATALAGAVLIVGRLLILAYRHIRRYPEDELTQALFAALVAGLGYSLVSGVIVMPVPQTLLFTFAGLVWGRVNLAEKSAVSRQTDREGGRRIEPSNSIRSWQSVLAALLVLVLTVPYMWFVSNYFLQATSVEGPHDGPGFWRNGAAFTMPE